MGQQQTSTTLPAPPSTAHVQRPTFVVQRPTSHVQPQSSRVQCLSLHVQRTTFHVPRPTFVVQRPTSHSTCYVQRPLDVRRSSCNVRGRQTGGDLAVDECHKVVSRPKPSRAGPRLVAGVWMMDERRGVPPTTRRAEPLGPVRSHRWLAGSHASLACQ